MSVFVWTISDMLGLIVFALVAIVLGVMFLLLYIDHLWWRWTGKHLPYNRPKAR